MTRTVNCIKLGQEAEGLDFAPYPGELGEKIYNQISKDAWGQWLTHQTMLINEYKLNMLDEKARDFLEKEMKRFFFDEENENSEQF